MTIFSWIRGLGQLVDKAFALGELDGIDVTLIICKHR